MGVSTVAKSAYETVIGRFNTIYTPADTVNWNTNDRLFVIGNGTENNARSDAMVVLKNGNIGIGTSTPNSKLHISSASGENALRVQVGGLTKLLVASNGGLSIGHSFLPPVNGLFVNGNVGIGTSTPAASLHVDVLGGSAQMRISGGSSSGHLSELTFYAGLNYRGAIGSNNSLNYVYIYHGGNIIFKNGRIGIQTMNDPTFAVHLPNDASDGSGRGRANAWTTYSDGRVKSDRSDIDYGLNEIMMLKPLRYFQHNSSFENANLIIGSQGAKDIGFIAQDIYKLIPEIVNVPEDENTGLWGMNYEKLTPILVKAIQEQQAIIETMMKRIEMLEEEK
jgi:hypothetical protein